MAPRPTSQPHNPDGAEPDRHDNPDLSLRDDPFGADEPATDESPLLPDDAPLPTETEPLGFGDDPAPAPESEPEPESEVAPVAKRRRRSRLITVEQVEAAAAAPEKAKRKKQAKPAPQAKPKAAPREAKPKQAKPAPMPATPSGPGLLARLATTISEARATVKSIREEAKANRPSPEDAEWAGLDLSPPRHGRGQAEPFVERWDETPDDDDEFTVLVTPLSRPELVELQAYVCSDEVLFRKIERERQTESLRYSIGLAVGLMALAALTYLNGTHYVNALVAANAPAFFDHLHFLAPLLGSDYANAIYAGLGFVAPFLPLAAVTDMVVSGLRVRVSRSLPDAMTALAAAAFAVSGVAFLFAVRPLPVFVLAAAWCGVRYVTRRILTVRGH